MSPRSLVSIGLIQDAVTGDQTQALTATIARIREAAGRGAQIISLTELFNAPYFCKSLKQEYFNFAEPIPGHTTEVLRALAAELQIVLIVPMYERQGPGIYRNSAAVIDADGSLLGVYRKMHIPHDPMFEEKYYFTPGGAHHRAAWRRNPVLSHGDRLASRREGRVGRRTIGRVAHGTARARDRQRR